MKDISTPKKGFQGLHNQHETQNNNALPELLNMFSCCLSDEPTPIGPKITDFRERLRSPQVDQVFHKPGEVLQISENMIVGDLLKAFPQIESYLREITPLGMLSPMLDSTSLEMLLLDIEIDSGVVCRELEKMINNQLT